jgi:hypothetical protein
VGYTNDLKIICEGYLAPCRERIGAGATDTNFTYRDVDSIFCNIEQLYTVHASLVQKMQSQPLELIAECFVSTETAFNGYSTYCANHTKVRAP